MVTQQQLRRWTRDAHLVAALVLASTLLGYAFTGFAEVHNRWFPNNPTNTRGPVAFDYHPSSLDDPETWQTTAARAAAELDLQGRIEFKDALKPDGSLHIRFRRLAHTDTLSLGPGSGRAMLERSELGFANILGNLHQLHGSSGGPAYRVAALWLDFTAVAIILFAISGIALWAWLKADLLGAVILATSTLFTIFGVAAMTLGA